MAKSTAGGFGSPEIVVSGGGSPAAGGAAAKPKKTLAQRQQAARDRLTSLGVDPTLTGTLEHPGKFLKNLEGGKGPAWERLRLTQAASGPYQGPQQQLTKEQEQALAAGAPVDFKQQEDQMLGQLQDYVTQRLGVGLTPDEQATMKTELSAPVESAYQQGLRSNVQADVARGVDPRSGVGRQQAAELARTREQGLGDVNAKVVQADLERKQQIEQEAQAVASGEESQRQFDVDAQLRRLAQVEGGMGALAGLGETQRQYDLGYTESQRQAQLARDQWAKYARSLQPSGLEKWAGGIGGFFQGLGV